MNPDQALPLLGMQSPSQFMQRHWQKKPLIVRQAIPGFAPLVPRADLLAMAADDDVESRLVVQQGGTWRLRQGPMPRRALPPLSQSHWTLLVQGVDLHHQGVHELMHQFRFVPDARLDDLMISYATDGGGVGPHFDSYDVFLLQAHGQRRWRIGRQKNYTLRDDLPLKILADFQPEQDFVLNPGDMLYLPPGWAHDGIAQGECMTYSIGFRVPRQADMAQELLQRLAEQVCDEVPDTLYRDPQQAATQAPAQLPLAMVDFAAQAVQRALKSPDALARALGEYLTEPKAQVWFDMNDAVAPVQQVRLDRRTRMMYDARHLFINGDSLRAAGRDAKLLQRLADQRQLSAAEVDTASAAVREQLQAWCEAGWLHGD